MGQDAAVSPDSEKAVAGLGEGERGGLAPWTYFNPELLEVEKDQLFRRCWQMVGHLSDVPRANDFLTVNLVGEKVLTMRGSDGVVRSFRNACRHRGTPLKTDERGSCKATLVCPFHGWTYDSTGRLRGIPRQRSFPPIDPAAHGLIELETETWMGFIFVRFLPSRQPSMAELMRPYAKELEGYRLLEIQPTAEISATELRANWKSVRDIDNEGYHVPTAHPFLQDLYGQHYVDQPLHDGTSRSFGFFNMGTPRTVTVRMYRNLLGRLGELKPEIGNCWRYVGLYPNQVFVFYPEQVGFYQEFPRSVDRTIVRSGYYGLPDRRREMKLARYMGRRIDRVTGREDQQLVSWSWEAMQSARVTPIILSDLEAGVRRYHDWLRQKVPVTALESEPAPGTVATANARLVAANLK